MWKLKRLIWKHREILEILAFIAEGDFIRFLSTLSLRINSYNILLSVCRWLHVREACGLMWEKTFKDQTYNELLAINHRTLFEIAIIILSIQTELAKGIDFDEVIRKVASLETGKGNLWFTVDFKKCLNTCVFAPLFVWLHLWVLSVKYYMFNW